MFNLKANTLFVSERGIFTVITEHFFFSKSGVAETEDGSSGRQADEQKADKEGDPVSLPSHDQAAEAAESQPGDTEPELPLSQQDPEKMEVEKEENGGKETISLEERESVSAELINNDSGLPTTESLCEDPQKSPSPSPSVDDKECRSAADDSKSQPSPCLDRRSSSPLSLTADAQEVLSAEDGGVRLLPQSEEEEEDEQVKAEEHDVAIKQELQERKVKEELLLDELSNMSHGDESSSGFMGSPGEADAQLSMELGLEPSGRSHGDNLLTETDDSLPFEPMRGDREKVKRRGSPGRSRVKQVRSALAGFSASCFIFTKFSRLSFIASCFQCRSNSFPGRRRPRGGGAGRGRGGRSRLKAMASCIDAFLVSCFCTWEQIFFFLLSLS